MRFLETLIRNKMIIAPVFAWLSAQIIKTLVYIAVNREFRAERLLGDGGMPSAHSATVTALAVTTAFVFGLSSFEFAIASLMAIIVMHDAMGVRQVTGKQSVVLNELLAVFTEEHPDNYFTDAKLKEFVGHTPLQVIAGFLVGFLVALVYNMF